MAPILKKSFCILLCGFILLVHMSSLGLAQAASLSVNVKDYMVSIKAEQVPIIDILNAISDRAEIYYESRDPLTDEISLELKGISIEDCIKRLLRNRNYSITFKKTKDGRIVPDSINIFGTGSVVRFEPKPSIVSDKLARAENNVPQHRDDPMKHYQKAEFEQMFSNSEGLIRQVSAVSVEEGPDNPGGIRITKVSNQSAFKKIGLKEGDIVVNVNFKPIKTTGEFVEALQTAPEEETMVRIERIKENGDMDPIYIELNSPNAPAP